MNCKEKEEIDLAARVSILEARIARLTARENVTNPSCFANIFRERVNVSELDVENFYVVSLSSRQKILDFHLCSVGMLASVDVHPREVFRRAIIYNAHSIIVCHNHPSGDADPSGADRELTERIAKAGDLIGIPMLDHIILTEKDHYSFAQHGGFI